MLRGVLDIGCSSYTVPTYGLVSEYFGVLRAEAWGKPDLKTRMKAIDIMWLKKYLETPDKRPTWCWVANTLIKGDAYLHLTPRVEESARLKWALLLCPTTLT